MADLASFLMNHDVAAFRAYSCHDIAAFGNIYAGYIFEDLRHGIRAGQNNFAVLPGRRRTTNPDQLLDNCVTFTPDRKARDTNRPATSICEEAHHRFSPFGQKLHKCLPASEFTVT